VTSVPVVPRCVVAHGQSAEKRVCECIYVLYILYTQTVYNTKGTRAHTHGELIREWLWEPKGSSLEYS